MLSCVTSAAFTGNFDGLGKVREKELLASCVDVLGCAPDAVTVLDSPAMPDGMKANWPAGVVAGEVEAVVARHSIQAVVTFDAGGVSGHPNHIHTHRGVLHWASQVRGQRLATTTSQAVWRAAHAHDPTHPHALAAGIVPVWVLKSTPLLRKYSGVLDIAWSCLFESQHGPGMDAVRVPMVLPGYAGRTPVGTQLLLTTPDVATSHYAMVAHWSQYVWFRRLFVVFSRYTTMNTLQREA